MRGVIFDLIFNCDASVPVSPALSNLLAIEPALLVSVVSCLHGMVLIVTKDLTLVIINIIWVRFLKDCSTCLDWCPMICLMLLISLTIYWIIYLFIVLENTPTREIGKPWFPGGLRWS